MLEIQFSLNKDLREDVSQVDDMSLRYRLFLGDIVLKSDTFRIDLQWGWIPLLDFAYSLILICRSFLNLGSLKESLELTDSDGVVFFSRDKDVIEISTSFSEENLKVDIISFKNGLHNFYSELVGQIINNNANIIDNPNFKIYEDEFNDLSM